jgi:uncharacterized membrane protein
MQSRLRIAGHGLQPLLLMFPLGLFWIAFVFDLASLLGAPALIGTVAFWNLVAGLGGGLLAALPAGADVAGATGPAARVFVLALLIDVGVLITFAVLTLMRVRDPDRIVTTNLLLVELAGLAAAGFGAWFSGRLADPRAPVADPRPSRIAGRLADDLLNTDKPNTGAADRRERAALPTSALPTSGPQTSKPSTSRLQRLSTRQAREGRAAATTVRRNPPDAETCRNQVAHSGTEAVPTAARSGTEAVPTAARSGTEAVPTAARSGTEAVHEAAVSASARVRQTRRSSQPPSSSLVR